jgi:hypothetical protein
MHQAQVTATAAGLSSKEAGPPGPGMVFAGLLLWRLLPKALRFIHMLISASRNIVTPDLI